MTLCIDRPCCSHLDLVFVIEDLQRFTVLENFSALLEFELEQGIRDNANPNIDGFDVVFDRRNGLLNVLQGCIVTELLACIINLLRNVVQAFVDLLQFRLEILTILAHGGEVRLNFPELISMCAVITSHSLEISAQDAFLP